MNETINNITKKEYKEFYLNMLLISMENDEWKMDVPGAAGWSWISLTSPKYEGNVSFEVESLNNKAIVYVNGMREFEYKILPLSKIWKARKALMKKLDNEKRIEKLELFDSIR